MSDQPVTGIAAWLAERAEAAGMRVERFESSPGKCNVVASIGPAGTDGLLLSGHMDVVPVEGQRWSSDPFRLTERDGKVYGWGACDMKGFLASVTTALEGLSLRSLRRELVLAWTHDEEVGCHGSRALADRMVAEGRQHPTTVTLPPWPLGCLVRFRNHRWISRRATFSTPRATFGCRARSKRRGHGTVTTHCRTATRGISSSRHLRPALPRPAHHPGRAGRRPAAGPQRAGQRPLPRRVRCHAIHYTLVPAAPPRPPVPCRRPPRSPHSHLLGRHIGGCSRGTAHRDAAAAWRQALR